MPRVTIIPEDGSVYKDRLAYNELDLSNCGIPSDVHAFQWLDEEQGGWVEFTDSRGNEKVSSYPKWVENCLEKWEEAKKKEEEAENESEVEGEDNGS